MEEISKTCSKSSLCPIVKYGPANIYFQGLLFIPMWIGFLPFEVPNHYPLFLSHKSKMAYSLNCLIIPWAPSSYGTLELTYIIKLCSLLICFPLPHRPICKATQMIHFPHFWFLYSTSYSVPVNIKEKTEQEIPTLHYPVFPSYVLVIIHCYPLKTNSILRISRARELANRHDSEKYTGFWEKTGYDLLKRKTKNAWL